MFPVILQYILALCRTNREPKDVVMAAQYIKDDVEILKTIKKLKSTLLENESPEIIIYYWMCKIKVLNLQFFNGGNITILQIVYEKYYLINSSNTNTSLNYLGNRVREI